MPEPSIISLSGEPKCRLVYLMVMGRYSSLPSSYGTRLASCSSGLLTGVTLARISGELAIEPD
jgi:hypothetical protein